MQKGIVCKTPFCFMMNSKPVMNYTNMTVFAPNRIPYCVCSDTETSFTSAPAYFLTAPNHFSYSLSYSPFFFRSSRALLISLVSGLFFFREMP